MPLVADIDKIKLSYDYSYHYQLPFNDDNIIDTYDGTLHVIGNVEAESDDSIVEKNFTSKFTAKIDKQYINSINLFQKQFKSLKEEEVELDYAQCLIIFKNSLLPILDLKPEIISLELTHERSIYYTVRKNNYTFFIQHFFEFSDPDDESIITAFKGNEYKDSYAGSLSEVIEELNRYVELPKNTVNVSYLEEISA